MCSSATTSFYIIKGFYLFFIIVITSTSYVNTHFTPQWAVHIKGGLHVAEKVASEHGFVLLGEIMPDYYHFQGHGVAKRSTEPHERHQARLDADHRVHWAQQQRAKSRKKRDFLSLPSILSVERLNNPSVSLNDQRWSQMWYLNRGSGLDMNVLPAWKEGVTGKGVVVTILDDGLEKDHPDLIRNYDPLASYDVNNHDEDPMPRYDMIDSNRHGTRCAGEVAATANNTLCAVGVAYGASVGGVRMLDGDVTDAVEARSLSLNPQHIDIYSASWGPDDDGKTVDGPGELATRAFIEGVTKGRGGKGSIFVWASGNGGRDKDNCNCDGYTNSIWTLSISSATETGHVPWYSEACSSTLATTYSSGSVGEKQVVTTDLHHSCTSSHTGTSASAPLAAGICALALEANPNLTWRDMQHIVVQTAKPANLKANDWQINGVGKNVSHSFGYGLMDAAAMVRLAKVWKTVPEQQKCEISAQISDPTIPPKSRKKFSLIVKDCPGVNYLEHVQAKISLSTLRRGDLEINLTSPAGTRSTLLEHRSHDFSRQGFVSWPFMSVHTWGERPFGEWKLEIHNEGRTLNATSGLTEWKIILHGTETSPTATSKPLYDDLNANHKGNIDEIQINDLDQNVIASSNDRWRDEAPQIGEEVNHINLQQTAEELLNSSACLKSNGQICLDCREGYFLYFGVCVTHCPAQYYPTFVEEDLRTKKTARNRNKLKGVCRECHYSCLHCRGSNDYQCTMCFADSVLTNISKLESYCYPTSLTFDINNAKWFYRTYIVLLLTFLFVFVVIFSFIILYIYYRILNSKRRKGTFYTKLSLREIQDQLNLQKQLIKSAGTTAASDSD